MSRKPEMNASRRQRDASRRQLVLQQATGACVDPFALAQVAEEDVLPLVTRE